VRGTMMRSSASQVLGSPSTGSLEGCQLMGDSLKFCAIIAAIALCTTGEGLSTSLRAKRSNPSCASLALPCVNASRLSQAMTAVSKMQTKVAEKWRQQTDDPSTQARCQTVEGRRPCHPDRAPDPSPMVQR